MTRHSPSSDDVSIVTARRQIGRRRLLAAGMTVATVGLAGCTRAINYIADLALHDVNLFNETDQRLVGSITVTDPEDETALDEEFVIEPDEDDDEADEDAGEAYGDVLSAAGEYTVAVELDDESAVDGETTADATVEVEDPADEHIVVVFGAEDLEAPIEVLVIEEFTDMGDHVEE